MLRLRSDGKDSVLDIGSGSGDVSTEIIKSVFSNEFSYLLGADINPNIVKYANTNFRSSNIQFDRLDVGGDITDFLKKHNTFDHIISLLCLQLVPDQKIAMINIFNLLQPNGDYLL